jgi:hypothetical protein
VLGPDTSRRDGNETRRHGTTEPLHQRLLPPREILDQLRGALFSGVSPPALA